MLHQFAHQFKSLLMQLMRNGRKGNCAARPKKGVHQFALGGVGESDARPTT